MGSSTEVGPLTRRLRCMALGPSPQHWGRADMYLRVVSIEWRWRPFRQEQSQSGGFKRWKVQLSCDAEATDLKSRSCGDDAIR